MTKKKRLESVFETSWNRLGAILTIKKNLALQLNGKRAYFRRSLDFELSCCFVLQLPVMKFFDSVCVVSFCLFCVVLFVVSPRIRLVSSCSSCFVLCRLVFSFGLFAFFCPVRLASSSLVLTVSSSSCVSNHPSHAGHAGHAGHVGHAGHAGHADHAGHAGHAGFARFEREVPL